MRVNKKLPTQIFISRYKHTRQSIFCYISFSWHVFVFRLKLRIGYEFSYTIVVCPEENDNPLSNFGKSGSSGMDFPITSEECLALLVLNEPSHMPKDDYVMRLQSGTLDSSVRTEAIDWIWKVHAHYSFGLLTVYLSVNYLDRFLSYYELPERKAWITQLLSITCLSLAAKMEENEVPLSLDLQAIESNYKFDARTIQRMELLVLSTLDWKMLAVTPFSFIDYFLQMSNDGKSPPRSICSKSMELILNTTRRIELLEFTPSEVAAAVALHVLRDPQIMTDSITISFGSFMKKDRVMRCCEVIRNMPLMNVESTASQSPNGVLDTACFSYRSSGTVESQPDSYQKTSDAKRRKLKPMPLS